MNKLFYLFPEKVGIVSTKKILRFQFKFCNPSRNYIYLAIKVSFVFMDENI